MKITVCDVCLVEDGKLNSAVVWNWGWRGMKKLNFCSGHYKTHANAVTFPSAMDQLKYIQKAQLDASYGLAS